jgi:hypothetical protein
MKKQKLAVPQWPELHLETPEYSTRCTAAFFGQIELDLIVRSPLDRWPPLG